MAINHATMERLSYIKYLYNDAVEESQRPGTLCSKSLLTFHDSVEFFLRLASEHLEVGRKEDRVHDQ